MMLAAQMRMNLECTKDSGSTPAVSPMVMTYAVQAPESQYVRSATVAPSRLKKGSPTLSPCRMPWVPR